MLIGNASVSVVRNALVSLAGESTRNMWFDAEGEGERFCVVMRGEDRYKAGGKNEPALKWNDESGAARRLVLCELSGEGSAEYGEALAQALRSFYGAEGEKIDSRLALVESAFPEAERETLSIVAQALFLIVATVGQNGANPHANAGSRWRVGSFNKDTREAKRAARESKAQSAAVEVLASADENKLAEIAANIKTPAQLKAFEALLARAQALQSAGA